MGEYHGPDKGILIGCTKEEQEILMKWAGSRGWGPYCKLPNKRGLGRFFKKLLLEKAAQEGFIPEPFVPEAKGGWRPESRLKAKAKSEAGAR